MGTSNFQPFRDLLVVFQPVKPEEPVHRLAAPGKRQPHYIVELWMRPHVATGEAAPDPADEDAEELWDSYPLREVPSIREANHLRMEMYQTGLLDPSLIGAWEALLSAPEIPEVEPCPEA